MASASWSADIAQPRNVRIAGRRCFVTSIEIPTGQIRPLFICSERLAQSRDSRSRWLRLFHVFRRSVKNLTTPRSVFLVCAARGYAGGGRNDRNWQDFA
jgi:hypothetical protein